jgi:hypothetical protein
MWKLSKKNSITSCLLVIALSTFSYDFKSDSIDKDIYCEIRCCTGNSPLDKSVKLSEEGLTCKNPDPRLKRGRTIFIDYLSLDRTKLNAIQSYFHRNDFFNRDSVYSCPSNGPHGELRTLIFRRYDQFKVIKYFECSRQDLDSVYIYLNDLIPRKYKKIYSIPSAREGERNCDCLVK